MTQVPETPNRTIAPPRFIALRPLFNHLVNRANVEVRELQADGTLSSPTSRIFGVVDAEVWTRRFLADLDNFISIQTQEEKQGTKDFDEPLQAALSARLQLAAAIPNCLMTLLDVEDPNAATGLQQATEVLAGLLKEDLSSGYNVATMVQFDIPADGSSLVHDVNDSTDALEDKESFRTHLVYVTKPAFHRDLDVTFDVGALTSQSEGKETDGPARRTVSVPIPLRQCIAAPVLISQSAAASYNSNGSDTSIPLASIPQWTFGMTFSHEFAAQD